MATKPQARRRTARWIARVIVPAAAFLGLTAPAAASAAARPGFSTGPDPATLSTAFGWNRHDYAVRCDGTSLQVHVDGAGGWSSRVGGGALRAGSYDVERPLAYDQGLTIGFKRDGAATVHRSYVRCLPADFPSFDFDRIRPGGPELFGIQIDPYATIFSSDGAPIWWFDSGNHPNDVEVLPDKTIAWNPVDPLADVKSPAEIRKLNGHLVRTVSAAEGRTDLHELTLLPNGNYLLGGRVIEHHVDATPFGGAADADVVEIEVQEVTPGGKLVWKWDSGDHIRIGETPRRWGTDYVVPHGQPYDVVHWNSAEVDGKLMVLSFRHLDAVYAINRHTGRIVWKLGGTPTGKSLKVLGDPEGSYPLGGQHDARLLPDGTISIHDNNTGLSDPPRVVRYRVNRKKMTARLVSALTDSRIPTSICCGSARLTPSGGWLVGWGGNPVTTAYDAKGRSLYRLDMGQGFSYRSMPVTPGLVTAADLRDGMDAMQP